MYSYDARIKYNVVENTDFKTEERIVKTSEFLDVESIKNEMSTKEITKSEVKSSKEQSINIDSSIFNSVQIRLNTDLYNSTESVFNRSHIVEDYGIPQTNLAKSFVDCVDPLIPVALTINETGTWMDTCYTWSSAVYSKLLSKQGCDVTKLNVDAVNVDTYVANGLCSFYGCGTNCTAGSSTHYHTIGNNDNDSLGPLQILRHYVEGQDGIKYSCGNMTLDLMSWKDNVMYFTHKQPEYFMAWSNWNRDYTISNKYELLALMAVAHNTGTSYLVQESAAGSLWYNSKSVYDFCRDLCSEDSLNIIDTFVDEWWLEVIAAQEKGEAFVMLGQKPMSCQEEILETIGLDKLKYASRFEHKQYYPVKALLNYKCLERLYFSGGDISSEIKD